MPGVSAIQIQKTINFYTKLGKPNLT